MSLQESSGHHRHKACSHLTMPMQPGPLGPLIGCAGAMAVTCAADASRRVTHCRDGRVCKVCGAAFLGLNFPSFVSRFSLCRRVIVASYLGSSGVHEESHLVHSASGRYEATGGLRGWWDLVQSTPVSRPGLCTSGTAGRRVDSRDLGDMELGRLAGLEAALQLDRLQNLARLYVTEWLKCFFDSRRLCFRPRVGTSFALAPSI